MTAIQKIIDKFKLKPESLKFRDIDRILLSIGFEKIQTKGSHTKYKKVGFISDIIVPIHNNECKDFYKKQILKNIEKLL